MIGSRVTVLAVAALLTATAAAPAAAQSWRTLDVSRQLHDTSALRVEVEYGAGRLELQPTVQPLLYQMRLRYDAARVEPLYVFAADTRTLRLGVHKQTMQLAEARDRGELRVDLARTVPLDLVLKLGAVEADLDLGGLSVRNMRVESGASEATVHFDAPNPIPMNALDFAVGAASLEVSKLANANVSTVRVEAGVGSVDLDFGGAWTRDISLDIEVALGGVRVHVPSDVGVRVELSKVLGTFEQEGLTKRGDTYYSENWDTAAHKLTVRGRTTLGKFVLDRM